MGHTLTCQMHITLTLNSLKASSLEVFADSCCLSLQHYPGWGEGPAGGAFPDGDEETGHRVLGRREFRRGSSEGQISIRIYIQLLIHVKCVRRSVWKDLWPWADLTWVHVFTGLSAESVWSHSPADLVTRVLGPVMVISLVLNTLVSTTTTR